ncbi:hypothetical protein [Okeania sp. SIO2B3]|uniref:hypothetical protein n=1 Tax=Okeania sp. SIO2B3 TaxID=2607784 RepID=UPI0013BF4BFD|nr:hypothetical protein [Okeania sp. SIO2B3]NET45963.1 hypothetical protein [Okeania sp. SIO2B3]
MKSVNYFVSKKPSERDQQNLDQLDELIPQMNFEELLISAYQILDNLACCIEDTDLSREVVELATSLDEDISEASTDAVQVAVLKLIMYRLGEPSIR